MKKVFSIILVLVALLIVCTACDPTVGDDGRDEDRRVIELTFEIESLEAQVNEADNSSDLSALKDWAESCQIKIDTLRIEGESEVLDALEKRIEAVKELIEEKKYPIVLLTEQGVDDLLNWLASNELYRVLYNPILGVQVIKEEEPYVRYEHDLEVFITYMLSNMETYSWVSENIAELLYYTSSGAHYEYMCTEDKIEDASTLVKSKVQFPVSLGFYEDFEEVMDSFDSENTYMINFDSDIQCIVKDKVESDDLESSADIEAFNGVTLNGGSFSVVEEGVLLCINPSGGYTYVCVDGKQNKYFELLENGVNYPIALNDYSKFNATISMLGSQGTITKGGLSSSGNWEVEAPSTSMFAETGKGSFSSWEEVRRISYGVIELRFETDYCYLFLNDGNGHDVIAREEAEKHPRVLM